MRIEKTSAHWGMYDSQGYMCIPRHKIRYLFRDRLYTSDLHVNRRVTHLQPGFSSVI